MQIVNKKKYSEEGCSSVMFSSVAAAIGEKSNFAYSAAKIALQAAVRSIAKEIGESGVSKRCVTCFVCREQVRSCERDRRLGSHNGVERVPTARFRGNQETFALSHCF